MEIEHTGSVNGSTVGPDAKVEQPMEDLRDWLRAVADMLIPAGDGMPAASGVGVADAQLDLVLAARPDLMPLLLRAMRAAGDAEPAEVVDRLRVADPEALEGLRLVVAGGYYASRKVRALLTYTGQIPVQVRPDTYPAYVAEGLIDRVLERGPCYREVPPDPPAVT
jgi:hypothetical protein